MNPIPVEIDGAVRLADWGLLRVHGADALSFLNSQLTQQLAHLPAGQARLAGYCSPKGRLLASFVAWRSSDDAVMLACSADLLASAAKRLAMYVLRANCRVEDASPMYALVGLAGRRARESLGNLEPPRPWGVVHDAQRWIVALPRSEGVERFIVVAPLGEAVLPVPAIDAEAWRWLEVRSAIPRITAATVEQFVPQMINFELVGGVDFQKGCYPGQEVVARSQYRGSIKRRMFLFESDVAAQPGDEIVHSEDPDQPAGKVVNAATLPGRPTSVLAEVKLAALEAGTLHLKSLDSAALRRLDLPYPLPDPATT